MDPVYKLVSQLANSQRRVIDRLAKDKPYSGTQGKVIHYLYENDNRDVYQKDIEKVFGLRAATATELINSLEEEGWLMRVPSEKDRRIKNIVLTPQSKELKDSVFSDIETLEKRLTLSINDNELTQWIKITNRMIENLKVTDE